MSRVGNMGTTRGPCRKLQDSLVLFYSGIYGFKKMYVLTRKQAKNSSYSISGRLILLNEAEQLLKDCWY